MTKAGQPAEIVRIENWFVVADAGGVQWILMKDPKTEGGEPKPYSFCRSRLGLVRSVKHHCGEVPDAAMRTLLALPEFIETKSSTAG